LEKIVENTIVIDVFSVIDRKKRDTISHLWRS